MSIQSEISRIRANVQLTYQAAQNVGVPLPEKQNSDNLPALIEALADLAGRYTITYNLTNVTSNNSTGGILKGLSYSATLTVGSGYQIKTATVTMGGTDITSSCYSNGVITIPSVTGDIVITATASMNLVTLATTTDGATIFGEDYDGNGVADGYQKSAALGGSGEYSGANYAKGFATGYININPKKCTLTLKNFGTTDVYYSAVRIIAFGRLEYGSALQTITLKTLPVDSEGNLVITPDKWTASGTPAYIRVSGYWTGNAPEISAQ